MNANEAMVTTIDTPGELIVFTEGLVRELPPILAGNLPGRIEERVERFFLAVDQIFEAWVARRTSTHTQRAYRQSMPRLNKLRL